MKYAIPGLSTLIAAILWIGERWLSQTFSQTLFNVPWGWLLVSTSALLVGVIYADALNKNSALRLIAKKITKIVNVENFVLAHKIEDGECWYEAVIHVRFLKRHKNVSCSVQVTQYVGITHAEYTLVASQEHIYNAEENLLKKFVVAKFPQRVSKEVSVGYPYWGSDSSHTWAGDGNHVITLKLSTGFRRQTEKFLISAIKNVGDGPEPVILFGDPCHDKYVQIC